MASSAPSFLDHPGPLAFAHQGGNQERAGNSLGAFRHAIEDLDYRYVELDVRLSSDDVVMVIHDDRVDDVSNSRGKVAELTAAELAEVRLFGPDGRPSGEGVPRLEDVLVAWPDVRVNVDAKEARVVGPLVELVKRLGAVDRMCFGAFRDSRVAAIRKRLGSTICSVGGPLATARLSAASFGLPVGRLTMSCAQVPVRQWKVVPVLSDRLVREAHERGIAVHVWTIDDADEMQRLLDRGVDGIMTDRPSVLRDVLVRRGQWVGRSEV